MTINELYNERCSKSSDINEHLPILFKYAKKCDHITEFGVRTGNSTIAFLAANPKKLISYDINIDKEIQLLTDLSIKENINFYYIIHSSHTAEIEYTDLLFIDTDHGEFGTSKELENTKGKISKYIILHDSVTFGRYDAGDGNPINRGILFAIDKFLNENKNWKIIEDLKNNNGLLVLGNIDNI